MEIIMKVKCSSSPGAGSSPHSTLKIVDHHHQLQQHTYTNPGYKSNTPPQHVIPTRTYTPNSLHPSSSGEYRISSAPPPPPPPSSCNDCSLGYCCNIASCCVTTPNPPHYQQQIPPQQFSSNPCQPPSFDEPEFVSIDDEKVKQYLMKVGQQQLVRQEYNQTNLRRQNEPKKITHVYSGPATQNEPRPVVYEIIELDDEDEREKLKQIKQQAEQNIANRKMTPNINMNYAARHTKSLDISLIPKTPEAGGQQSCQQQQQPFAAQSSSSRSHKIVAEIDLLDSSNDSYMNDDDDDDETLPLVAVSCELQCDDEDDDNLTSTSNKNQQSYNRFFNANSGRHQPSMTYSKPSVDDVVILASDDEKRHHNDNLLVRWEEFEGQRERIFFECFLCGKKVQSSYNLRRHMMIHTGERPFGCDLCDRRFREFSDLKKHRRRHIHEPNFMCMVCHKLKPTENDPTRCVNCSTQSKNNVLMAAMKSATDADNAAANANVSLPPPAATQQIKPPNKPTITTPPPPSQSPRQQETSPAAPQNFPTITSVTSFNIAASVTAVTSQSSSDNSGQSGGNNINIKTSEQTQRLLDNIPAVHRPGYNQLGLITRKEFPCPLCNRAFGTRHNLKRHYMIHTGEKPFSCSKCRKPFREFSTLKKHMVTHIRERWYKCMRCPLKFRDFLKYTEHKETHRNDKDNDNEGEQPMASGSSSSAQYPSMQTDAYMDSNDEDSGSEDWLECCECGQRFNEIDAYNEHLKEHDINTQIFQCYICKQQFELRRELDEHLLQHKDDIEDIEDDGDNDEDDDDDDDDDI